jgi:hypothetical protein
MIYVSRRTEWRRRPDAVDAVDADADADVVARAVEDAVVEDGIRAVDDGYPR